MKSVHIPNPLPVLILAYWGSGSSSLIRSCLLGLLLWSESSRGAEKKPGIEIRRIKKNAYCALTIRTGEKKWLLPIKLCPLLKSSDLSLADRATIASKEYPKFKEHYCWRLMHRSDRSFVQGMISAKFPFLNSLVLCLGPSSVFDVERL